jgi:hypothetical protein
MHLLLSDNSSPAVPQELDDKDRVALMAINLGCRERWPSLFADTSRPCRHESRKKMTPVKEALSGCVVADAAGVIQNQEVL